MRESDTVARLGGDEFVVILPGLDPAHATFETMTVLARIRESFLTPFRLADQTPTLTCSIGVSMYPLDANDPVTLIKQADTAMYAAKEVGRNAYRFYTADMNARVQARLQLETDMRRGLMDNEFFLVYQPQIDMQTGRTCAVEALLRWRDPTRGVIAPTEFIPIAEESGMIQALGSRVLRDACRQVVQWHKQGMMLRLSVNLSVQQLQHDSWLAIVEEALSASGLAPQYLDLEITESLIITHPERAVATLAKLKERGISITVDDFGTGYSSLSYLARLPIHAVKIDQRFVHGLAHNVNDVAITQAIIALSHSLGLRVIAEGVESAAQFDFLKRHGCEDAQGFLISSPLEDREFPVWWKAQQEEQRARCSSPTCGCRKAAADGAGRPKAAPPQPVPTGRGSGFSRTGRRACRCRAAFPRRRRRSARGCRRARPRPTLLPRRRRAPRARRNTPRQSRPDVPAAPHGTARRRARPRPPPPRPGRSSPAGSTACRRARPPSPLRPFVAVTPHARLAPMPSSASAQRTTRAPAAPSAAASAASSGRTTATTRGSAARRLRQAVAPTHSRAGPVPEASGTSSLSPPKRTPRPAASRMPTMPGVAGALIAKRECASRESSRPPVARHGPKKSRTFSMNDFARGLCAPGSLSLIASNSRSNSFCRAVRFTGVSTATWQNRSPVTDPRTGRMPLLRSRKTCPVCVSGGTLIFACPSSVGISMSPPVPRPQS